jgi:predicted ATPase
MTAIVPRPGEPAPAARTMRDRDPEWAAVLGLLKAAEAGRPGVLLVEGEHGTGKSVLLEEATRAAVARGMTLVSGRARELSLTPAEPLLSALGEPPPADPPQRPWIVERMRSNLEKRARAGPVLVSLDDLHWADPATLAAVQALAGQLGRCPVAWLLTRRMTGRGDAAGPRSPSTCSGPCPIPTW